MKHGRCRESSERPISRPKVGADARGLRRRGYINEPRDTPENAANPIGALEAVGATRWLENGDHPEDEIRMIVLTEEEISNLREVFGEEDMAPFPSEGKVVRYYRNPHGLEDRECGDCGHMMHYHGWIDISPRGRIVCPGDYVIDVQGEVYPVKSDLFEAIYEED